MGWALVEFPLGTRPTPQLFPVRNRIISGLALVTQAGVNKRARYLIHLPSSLVMSSAAHSMTLVTAGAITRAKLAKLADECITGAGRHRRGALVALEARFTAELARLRAKHLA